MSTGTTLVEVKQALVARLKARPGLSGVGVHYAYPADFAEGRDGDDIWLGDAEATHAAATMRGGAALQVDEDYRLTIHVQALKFQGGDQKDADIRGVELLSEVQQEIATNPQLVGVLMIELAGWRHVTGAFAATPSAFGSRFEVQARIRARLA